MPLDLLSTNGSVAAEAPLTHWSSLTQCLVIMGYTVIFVLGVAGNVLVVVVVVRCRQMRTITNIFICNLALSDLLMCAIAVPFTPLTLFMHDWFLPAALCKLLPVAMGVSVYVSTLTSTAIAADRFFIIVHPFIPRMKTSLCGVIISVIWALAVLISLPLAVYQTKFFQVNANISKCLEIWSKESSRELFTLVSFLFQFVLPCCIISICYYRISDVLRQRCKTKIGTDVISARSRETEVRRKRKTNKMFIAMGTIFVLCWIPLNLLWMTEDFLLNFGKINFRSESYFLWTFFTCHMIAMSSAVYNPFLYAWLNDNFKREFLNLMPCLACVLRTTETKIKSTTLQSECINLAVNANE